MNIGSGAIMEAAVSVEDVTRLYLACDAVREQAEADATELRRQLAVSEAKREALRGALAAATDALKDAEAAVPEFREALATYFEGIADRQLSLAADRIYQQVADQVRGYQP